MESIIYFFSNELKQEYVERLAESDEHEVVHSIKEFFADYYAFNSDFYSLSLPSLLSSRTKDQHDLFLSRTVSGLYSLLLSVKKRPSVIRYQGNSELAGAVAAALQKRIGGARAGEGGEEADRDERKMFDFKGGKNENVCVLVLDRVDDPVTPLLLQWTYQSMIHDLIGIENNTVDLSYAPGVKPEMKKVLVSTEQDLFFKMNLYNNYGELGESLKKLVDEFKVKTQSNESIQTIKDMKKFVEEYPELRKLSGNVSKHVTVMGEISRIIERRSLLTVSEIEQELACNEDHSSAVKKLNELFEMFRSAPSKFCSFDLLKLVLLYYLRYEQNSACAKNLREFIQKIREIIKIEANVREDPVEKLDDKKPTKEKGQQEEEEIKEEIRDDEDEEEDKKEEKRKKLKHPNEIWKISEKDLEVIEKSSEIFPIEN